MNHENSQETPARALGHQLAQELSEDEINLVAGGVTAHTGCMGTTDPDLIAMDD